MVSTCKPVSPDLSKSDLEELVDTDRRKVSKLVLVDLVGYMASLFDPGIDIVAFERSEAPHTVPGDPFLEHVGVDGEKCLPASGIGPALFEARYFFAVCLYLRLSLRLWSELHLLGVAHSPYSPGLGFGLGLLDDVILGTRR